MEVKPGYKQTEIGVLPNDWEVRKLFEHFRIYAGGDAPKHSLSETQSASHPYPIFANALQDKGLYGYTNERRSKEDSLTITARGYLGHAEYRDEPFFPIVRLLVLEPTGQLDARFTTYAVNDRVEFAIESTGVPQLTAPQVGSIRWVRRRASPNNAPSRRP
jgi:type I restriction enzyme S subunit